MVESERIKSVYDYGGCSSAMEGQSDIMYVRIREMRGLKKARIGIDTDSTVTAIPWR